MPTWNTDQYLRFANERTQPAFDLAQRVALANPSRVVDLGCGPGNSTAVVAQRWPQAAITGVDNSAAMLATARRDHPSWTWVQSDIATWPNPATERYDVIFSNAALQWVPEHPSLLPKLFAAVASGGALAFQIPYTQDVSHQRRMRELAATAYWQKQFTHPPAAWHVEPAAFYYDVLAPLAARIELWVTDYAHVMKGPDGIVEWYRGTGLRPYLEALPGEASRAEFLAAYLAAITPDHPRQADGKVIMYFRRLFVVAYR